jgi:RsiW-degrading membrane proteinase PrsW (M82 family)
MTNATNDLIETTRKWWLIGALIAFTAVELSVGYYVYFRESCHGNDGLEILGSSLLLGLLVSLPTAVLVAFSGWLLQKSLNRTR